MDPGRKATRSGCPSAMRGRLAAGRWAPGSVGCRRSGIWMSDGWRGRTVGRGRGRCACAEERRWSNGGRCERESWTGGGGLKRSADEERRKMMRRCRRGRCSCRRYRHSGRWWCKEETPSASSVGDKQQSSCHFCDSITLHCSYIAEFRNLAHPSCQPPIESISIGVSLNNP